MESDRKYEVRFQPQPQNRLQSFYSVLASVDWFHIFSCQYRLTMTWQKQMTSQLIRVLLFEKLDKNQAKY